MLKTKCDYESETSSEESGQEEVASNSDSSASNEEATDGEAEPRRSTRVIDVQLRTYYLHTTARRYRQSYKVSSYTSQSNFQFPN